ncbi:hypothetical protein OAD28_09155, partial [Flavobacteriales bacterium]|nr:hypothetical protein [Flavobacteriales bacterium]
DALEFSSREQNGTILINPPYGERIYKDEVNVLYERFGNYLKENYKGFNLGVLTSNQEAMDLIDLEKTESFELMNGSIDCNFQMFKV